MRVTARPFAPLLALVAFVVPASLPAAQAATVPAPTAVVVDDGSAFAPNPVVAVAGSQLAVVNASGTVNRSYRLYTLSGSLVSTAQYVASTPVARLDVPPLNPSAPLNTYRLTNGSYDATVVVVL